MRTQQVSQAAKEFRIVFENPLLSLETMTRSASPYMKPARKGLSISNRNDTWRPFSSFLKEASLSLVSFVKGIIAN